MITTTTMRVTQPISSSIINKAGSAAQRNVVPATTDPSLQTPEDVNRAVDQAEQRVNQANEARELDQRRQRSNVVQINAQRNQQAQQELYASIVSDSEISTGGNSTTAQQISSFAQPFHTYKVAQTTGQIDRQETDLQAELQSRIEESIGEGRPQSRFDIYV